MSLFPFKGCYGSDAYHCRHESAEKRQLHRRTRRAHALDRLPPNSEELNIVHQLFLEEGSSKAGILRSFDDSHYSDRKTYMDETTLRRVVVTMPQDRNLHNKIFGGWLMREAFELAWATAYTFTGQAPDFLSLDEVNFYHPVEIGSILHLHAQVVLAQGSFRTSPITAASHCAAQIGCEK